MSSMVRGYPTVSHVFGLAPATAAVAFDVMILDPAVAGILVPTGPLFRARPSGYAAWRRLSATLRTPGRPGRGVGVVLELLPWSDQRSELAISTAARPHVPVAGGVDGYVRAAHGYLVELAELLDSAIRNDPRLGGTVDGAVVVAGRPPGPTGARLLPEPRMTEWVNGGGRWP